MGKIYEEIEVEGEKVKVKVDTASDFALSLRRETIEKLKLPLSPKKALLRTEEGPKESPVYLARVKIGKCEFGSPQIVVEAFGDDNLLGHPILQALDANIDEKNKKIVFDSDMCPRGNRGGITGKIIE